MTMKILILEDNDARALAMQELLRDRFHPYDAVVFDDANEMLAFLRKNLASALLICLDHDLEMKPSKNGKMHDPGTGREVADFLAQNDPICPVIIHTTNSAAGDGMEFLLREAGWETHRVQPFNDLEWIATQWFRTVRNAIVGTARPRPKNTV
ncbi:MAG: response regulator [Planctomycetes bacterium]|nr:response regulator [Planctomycetota bacterium]